MSELSFQRYNYVFDQESGEVIKPSILLMDNNFNKKGEIFPYSSLKIVHNMNASNPNECSFKYNKLDEDDEIWRNIKNGCIVNIKNYDGNIINKNWGTYVLTVDEAENDEGSVKSVSGNALYQVELSNILCSLEVNTEDDIKRTDYDVKYPTVFCREIIGEDSKKKESSSLLHRILSYAPHYKVGHVDPTLMMVKKTFSWSDQYIMDVLNQVSEEVGCVFTFDTYVDDDGKPIRILNAYDLTYCKKCYENEKAKVKSGAKTLSTSKYRTITNGVCENCNSSADVYDCGSDTGIYIGTDNLSTEINLTPNGDVKNVFKVSGGDDIITAAVQGLNMTSSNKIMLFSDSTKAEMSEACRNKLGSYESDYINAQPHYEELLETEYNIYDILEWLKSAKMPTVYQDQKELTEEVEYILSSIKNDWNNDYYVSSYDSDKVEGNYKTAPYSLTRNSIENMFKLYMDSGFSVNVTPGNINDFTLDSNNRIQWEGTVRVYVTSNRNSYADIAFSHTSGCTATYHITESSDDTNVQTFTRTYSYVIDFAFGDKSADAYKTYIEQYSTKLLADYNVCKKKNQEEKDWKLYGYEPLRNYLAGYEKCIQVLQGNVSTSSFSYKGYDSIEEYIISLYSPIRDRIARQMTILCDEINALYKYLVDDFTTYSVPDYVDENYSYQYFSNQVAALKGLTDKSSDGYIGDHPFSCKRCESTNVSYINGQNVCNNCGATGDDIESYASIAQQVYSFYVANFNGNTSIISERNQIQNKFNISNYFGSDYKELFSFIKEDTYSNENYISTGLSNAEIIKKAKELRERALGQLAVACVQQYNMTASIASIITQSWKSGRTLTDRFSDFKLANWIHAKINGMMYKLRVTNITYDFDDIELTDTEFSSVTKTKFGSISDIESILKNAKSISATYNTTKKQASQGNYACEQFDILKQDGLDSAQMNILAGTNKEVTVDDKGILIRKYLPDAGIYSKYQMRLSEQNLVITDSSFKTTPKLAIGYGKMPDGNYGYGIWADLLMGNMTCTKTLIVKSGDGSVTINDKGIVLDRKTITWTNPLIINDVDGLNTNLDKLQENIDAEATTRKNSIAELDRYVAKYLGLGGTTIIGENYVISPIIEGGYLNIVGDETTVTIDPKNLLGQGKVIYVKTNNEDKFTVDKNGNVVLAGTLDTAGSGYLFISNKDKTNYVSIDPSSKGNYNSIFKVVMNNNTMLEINDSGSRIGAWMIDKNGCLSSTSQVYTAMLHPNVISISSQQTSPTGTHTVDAFFCSDMHCNTISDPLSYVSPGSDFVLGVKFDNEIAFGVNTSSDTYIYRLIGHWIGVQTIYMENDDLIFYHNSTRYTIGELVDSMSSNTSTISAVKDNMSKSEEIIKNLEKEIENLKTKITTNETDISNLKHQVNQNLPSEIQRAKEAAQGYANTAEDNAKTAANDALINHVKAYHSK